MHGNIEEEMLPTDPIVVGMTDAVTIMEHQLTDKFLAEFGNIFASYGFDNETLECIRRHHKMFTSREQATQLKDRLIRKVAELTLAQERIDNQFRLDYLIAQSENREDLLVAEGKKLAETIDKFVKYDCINSIIRLKEAFIEGTEFAILYVHAQMSVRKS